MSVPKLSYFGGVRGRAEPMVLAYTYSKTKFVHEQLTNEQFGAMKEKLPYGQLPVLEVNGTVHGESKAIASYVAKTTGLAGKTPEDALRVDEAYCLSAGLMESIGGIIFCADEKEKSEKLKKLTEETAPKFMGFFDKLICKESGWVLTHKEPSMADFAIQDIL